MEPTKQDLRATISDLEDRYAELLAQDAPDSELAQLWMQIRQLRQQLDAPAKAMQRP